MDSLSKENFAKILQADGGTMAGPREFRWQMSERQWAYLGWLVKNTGLGRTEKDVAQYLLTQKIQEMRLAKYVEPNPEG
jgi:hypothetical protein